MDGVMALAQSHRDSQPVVNPTSTSTPIPSSTCHCIHVDALDTQMVDVKLKVMTIERKVNDLETKQPPFLAQGVFNSPATMPAPSECNNSPPGFPSHSPGGFGTGGGGGGGPGGGAPGGGGPGGGGPGCGHYV